MSDYAYEICTWPVEDYKCPMCGSSYENSGCEEFKAGWRIEYCGFCGYVYNVEG